MAQEKVKQIESITDVVLDPDNANEGTEHGRWMLEQSLRFYGAGRSVLVDKDGNVIAGNKTVETAADLDIPVKVVQTDGRELVVVQRTDLDLDGDDTKARELAYADNRTSQVGLSWDVGRIVAGLEKGVNLSNAFYEGEIDEMVASVMEQDDDAEELDPVPEMEIKPYEHHDYIVLIFKTAWDWQLAVDFFDIGVKAFTLPPELKGNLGRKIGLCRVLDGARVIEEIQAQCKS